MGPGSRPTIIPSGHLSSPPHNYNIMATMSFPPPVFTPGSLEASRAPIVAQFGSGVEGGFTLVSSSSGRRWHMIKADRDCQFGRIFLAVEVVYFPSSESWQFQGRGSFAIKVSDLPQKHFTANQSWLLDSSDNRDASTWILAEDPDRTFVRSALLCFSERHQKKKQNFNSARHLCSSRRHLFPS